MADSVLLEFEEEYGSILIELADDKGSASGWEDASLAGFDKLKKIPASLLGRPLEGLARTFQKALDSMVDDGEFYLEQYSLEFNVGLSGEGGADAGAVLKITSSGSFKCTYTWKNHKAE